MITIFNRKELLITMEIKDYDDVKRKLSEAGITYKTVVESTDKTQYAVGQAMYYIYVHKKDYEDAAFATHASFENW